MKSLKYIIPVILGMVLLSVLLSRCDPNRNNADAANEPVADVDTVTTPTHSVGNPITPDSSVAYTRNPQSTPSVDGYIDISWIDLADVTFEDKYYEEIKQYLMFPKFGDRVMRLKDQKVVLPGYVIPADVENGIFVLSAFTLSSCFFCGAAGPESVVQLNLAEGQREFRTDEWVTFKGTLRLNSDDIDQLNYILDDGEEVPAN